MSKIRKTHKICSRFDASNYSQNVIIISSLNELLAAYKRAEKSFMGYKDSQNLLPAGSSDLIIPKIEGSANEIPTGLDFELPKQQLMPPLGNSGMHVFMVDGRKNQNKFRVEDVRGPIGVHTNFMEHISESQINLVLDEIFNRYDGANIPSNGSILVCLGEVDLANIVISDISAIIVEAEISLDYGQFEELNDSGLQYVIGKGRSRVRINDFDEPCLAVVDFSKMDIDFTSIDELVIGDAVSVILDDEQLTYFERVNGNGHLLGEKSTPSAKQSSVSIAQSVQTGSAEDIEFLIATKCKKREVVKQIDDDPDDFMDLMFA